MDGVTLIAGWGVIATASAAIGGILASIKNRDYSFWIGWSFVFPPIVFVLVLLPAYKGQRPRQPALDDDDKTIF
ncbi:MAG: hypothetical protein AAGG72_00890 [Pseudomonadota bacterium]